MSRSVRVHRYCKCEPSAKDIYARSAVEIRIDSVAVGGDGLGRAGDGRVVLVPGALPGELIRVQITEERRSMLRGEVAEVLEPSPDRQQPWCPHVLEGCGGCGWQHVRPDRQGVLKRSIVIDALRRTAKLDPSEAERVVRLGPPLPDRGYRTTARGAVGPDGHLGMRAYHSDVVVPIATCGVLDPALDAAMWSVTVPAGVAEVEVRIGLASGDRSIRLLGGGPGEVPRAEPSSMVRETVAGVTFQISSGSFFQTSVIGAEALVKIVDDAVGPAEGGQRLIDLYGGVGLFAATVGRRFDSVTVVELAKSSCRDARANLVRHPRAQVVESDVARWRPARVSGPAPVVIADPARRGLDRVGVATVVACRPNRVVLVSCDVGAFARDVRLLLDANYSLVDATCLDLFPNTPLVEVISTFEPAERR